MNKETKTPQSTPEPIQALPTARVFRERVTALLKSRGYDEKQIANFFAAQEKLARFAKGGDKREAIYLQASRAGIIEAVKYEYIAEPLTVERLKKVLCSFISKAGQVAELKAELCRQEKDTADAETKAKAVSFYKQQCDSCIEIANNLGQGDVNTLVLANSCILLGGFMQLMELADVLTKEQLERQLLASMDGLLAGQQEHGAKIDGMAATVEAKRASELRAGLGYTRADLLILLDVLGLPEDRAGKLPLFPLPADYKSRKRIYEFTNSASMYAPLFAWCRSHEITAGHDGKRTTELYADDAAAKGRHWKLANAQEQLYNAIRANEAFIASETPQNMTLANSEKSVFYELLADLGKTVTSGQWGETPPPDVLGIIPRDPLADVAAKLADHDARTTAEHREHDTKLEGMATVVKKQRRDVAAIFAEKKLTLLHYLTAGMIADALQEALGSYRVPNSASVKTVMIRRLAKAEAQGRLHPRIEGKNKAKYYLNDGKLFDEILSYCAASNIGKITTDKDKEALAQVLLSTSKELSSTMNSRP
ncbi:hypothetical protein [Oligosphaera ethanolica]|uniref:Uncharacterized protein n=1 Tax=Oligosphaera ethanolica TaxID=760260 RepID=A0AAE3VCI6_9BACT|nr:hypothetical protein [Oligosphaera ethanolica]MDQ0287984.1 hypothetical protein [Oligosphaera ethanolica]